jgi:flagellar basal-body rod protein FlgF
MFAVQTAGGVRYTRAGDFHLSGSNQLVDPQGNPVLGANGRPVQVAPGAGTVHLEANGQLMRGGQPVGQVAVFLPATTQLQPVGQGLYQLAAGAPAATVLPANLTPGFLEGANVDVTGQMAGLLQIQQVFNADASALQAANNTMRTAQNDVGTTA